MATMSGKSCIKPSMSIYNLNYILASHVPIDFHHKNPSTNIETHEHEYMKCPSNLPLTDLSDKMGKDGGKGLSCFAVGCHHGHIEHWMRCYQTHDLSIHVTHTNQSTTL